MKRSWNKAKSKYGNIPRTYNGVRYDSRLEASYAAKLDILKKDGKIDFWIRQTPFDLSPGVRYFIDFVEFWADGTVRFTEVKGKWTESAKIKFKICQDLYNIDINVVTK